MPRSLPQDWLDVLGDIFASEEMRRLKSFLQQEISSGFRIYPPSPLVFEAFWQTKPQDVKLVLLGQDPYPQPDTAHGLAFSVQESQPIPASLRNIFQELVDDLGVQKPDSGNLLPWAQQGVLLLNSVLTVRAGQPGSHRNRGWEFFTNKVIEHLSTDYSHIVFLLWGAFAQEKKYLINTKKHYCIESVHPSPLSAYRGFFGHKPFSRANDYLERLGRGGINW